MRTKTVYIIENEDVELLKKANELMAVMSNEEIECECDEIELGEVIGDISNACEDIIVCSDEEDEDVEEDA